MTLITRLLLNVLNKLIQDTALYSSESVSETQHLATSSRGIELKRAAAGVVFVSCKLPRERDSFFSLCAFSYFCHSLQIKVSSSLSLSLSHLISQNGVLLTISLNFYSDTLLRRLQRNEVPLSLPNCSSSRHLFDSGQQSV